MRKALTAVAAAAFGFSLALPAAATDHAIGEELYQRYCAVCHGEHGGGGGDLHQLLSIDMPDLRTMTERNDGVFPMLETIHIIDGRTGLRAHGGPMPLWGGVFMAEAAEGMGFYGSAIEARGRVLSLALYLESLQE